MMQISEKRGMQSYIYRKNRCDFKQGKNSKIKLLPWRDFHMIHWQKENRYF